MRISTRSPVFMFGAAIVLIIVLGLGYALWQENRSESINFQIGEDSVEIETQG